MTPPELDAETKARIEAEEAYRAEVRARQATRAADHVASPAAPHAPQKSATSGCAKWVALVLGGLLLLGVLKQCSGGGNPASAFLPPSSGTPVGIEIQAQDTPDNYGIDLYMTANDAAGREIATSGTAIVRVLSDEYGQPHDVLWSTTVPVTESSFSRGTRGMGAFEREAVFAKLDSVTHQQLFVKPSDSVDIELQFTLPDGQVLSAKTNKYIP